MAMALNHGVICESTTAAVKPSDDLWIISTNASYQSGTKARGTFEIIGVGPLTLEPNHNRN